MFQIVENYETKLKNQKLYREAEWKIEKSVAVHGAV